MGNTCKHRHRKHATVLVENKDNLNLIRSSVGLLTKLNEDCIEWIKEAKRKNLLYRSSLVKKFEGREIRKLISLVPIIGTPFTYLCRKVQVRWKKN